MFLLRPHRRTPGPVIQGCKHRGISPGWSQESRKSPQFPVSPTSRRPCRTQHFRAASSSTAPISSLAARAGSYDPTPSPLHPPSPHPLDSRRTHARWADAREARELPILVEDRFEVSADGDPDTTWRNAVEEVMKRADGGRHGTYDLLRQDKDLVRIRSSCNCRRPACHGALPIQRWRVDAVDGKSLVTLPGLTRLGRARTPKIHFRLA